MHEVNLTLFNRWNRRSVLCFLLGVTIASASCPASADAPESAVRSSASASLPDAPSATLAQPVPSLSYSSSLTDPISLWEPTDPNAQATSPAAPTLLPRVKFVPAGSIAPRQTTGDKIALSLRESVTPFSAVAWVASAGWSHLIDSAPHYGTNSEAFAQRFGASVVGGVSKEIFTDGVFAPIFHQDPRYYQLGKSHKFINRAVYAGTRPFIGKTDSGKTIPNYANILGAGGAASLAQLYYPDPRDQGASQVMWSWASALGGSALGNVISELGGDVLQWLHLPKIQP